MSTAFLIPFLNKIGLAPVVKHLSPSLKIFSAKTVAVVVPSPAISLVFVHAPLRICTPVSSTSSAITISLAIVTPSLVTIGVFFMWSTITFLPFGPRVIFTAFARVSTPLKRAVLASSP